MIIKEKAKHLETVIKEMQEEINNLQERVEELEAKSTAAGDKGFLSNVVFKSPI